MLKKILLVITALFLIATAIFYFSRDTATELSAYNQVTLSINDNTLRSFVAETPEQRTLGLSGQESLEDAAMLFRYTEPTDAGIWMKDMLISIDIIWADENNEITHIEQNISPDTFPTIFNSPEESLYVIETPAGYVAQSGIEVGNIITIN